MDPRDHLRAGDVAAALAALKQDVRKAPRDPRLRTFLFQMFCVTGEWDRALTQLTVASELDPAAIPMMSTYEVAIRCEVLREKVFRGERTPMVLGEPGEWLPLLIEANRLLASGQPDQAATLRDAAFEAAPTSAGTADDLAFEWIADADPRLGPVVEAIVDGKYYWIPMAQVRSIALEPPADLRDQVWMPATFRWINEGESVGLIPTRYPGSAASADPGLMLAKRTEWTPTGGEDDGWVVGLGQRMFATDAGEVALMDLRRLSLPPAATDPPG